jgi:hypothetical protein
MSDLLYVVAAEVRLFGFMCVPNLNTCGYRIMFRGNAIVRG